MNGGRDGRFQAWFVALADVCGEAHHGFSMLMSIAFLTAVPRYFLAAGCRWEGRLSQRDSIAIENEDATIAERDFFRLPTGFVALVGVLPAEAGLIIIGRNPLFDGLPGWLDGLEGRFGRWGNVHPF